MKMLAWIGSEHTDVGAARSIASVAAAIPPVVAKRFAILCVEDEPSPNSLIRRREVALHSSSGRILQSWRLSRQNRLWKRRERARGRRIVIAP